MKISCTGSTGRVGRLLVAQGVVPLPIPDITIRADVERVLDSESPDVVIHLAGISKVDYCEVPENWALVRKVNFTGTVYMARACQDRNIPMVFLSSEHVFPGHHLWGSPYKEHDPVARTGVNNYALTKIACEGLRHMFPVLKVVRTSYLFNWVRLMTEELSHTGTYDYPTFLHRSYIYLPHFAHNLLEYARRIEIMPSILHLAGSKVVSQYQFMRDFVRYFHVQGIHIEKRRKEWPTGDNFPLHAHRPHRAGLDVQLAHDLGFPAYSYQEGFEQMRKDNVRG